MDELRNLQQMASLASGRFNQYDGEDFVLPQIFKEQVTEINSNTITYNKYSAIIETRGNQHGILNIFMPNQWFYIASYFTDFYNELQKYKRYALQVTSKERLKELNGGELTATELSALHRLTLDDKSMEYLLRFITDYSWWGGAKTIDRGDFYVSPILSNANLVNASQSFVADLCAFLADKQNLVRAIINKEESGSPINAKTLLFQPCIESKEGINGFLDRAIPIVLERDADLYRLDKFANVDGSVYLTIGRHNLGRASDKDARPNDINPNIEWTCGLNGKRYYLNREVNYPNFVTFQEAFNKAYKGIFEIVIDTIDYNGAQRKRYSLYAVNSAVASTDIEDSPYRPYLTALRTKPFLLLAGISGTGKSRIVRELAFMSCPKYLQDKDGVTPGNYCMIEVKPNWHDSTELLGYYSNISREYQFKKFVKFLVKAKMHPEVPFFVCLDEMNLAPVEQYFAEILSILETRKHPKTDEGVDMKTIKTEVLVEPQHFKYHSYKDESGAMREKLDMTDKDWYETFCGAAMMTEEERELINRYQYSRTLQQEGLSLPDNVIIIGTVNMDETTHQFSRKVIDRAMTIEMNGGRLVDMFGGSRKLEYLPEEQQQKWQAAFRQRYVCADEVLELHPEVADDIRTKLPARLEEINKALRGTPFEVSYRVLNELTIMVGVMLDDNAEGKDIDAIISEAIDNILLMKILPRVEGDSDMFELSGMEKKKHGVEHDNRLKWLLALAPEITVTEEEGANHRQTAKEKIQEMIDRLDSHEFTRYWP